MNPKILVVRRDNIGDLVCTLPLIESLRKMFPAGRIDILVNSYSASVVAQNNTLSHVYVYTKVKHKKQQETALGVYWRRFLMTISLRRVRYDWVILANVSCISRTLRWARQIKGLHTIGFSTDQNSELGILTDAVPLVQDGSLHEVEYLMQLLQPLQKFHTVKYGSSIPAPMIYPDLQLKEALRTGLPISFFQSNKKIVGLNISARKPSQQWAAENFISLINKLIPEFNCLLYWSPGASNASGHPGDDEKANEILAAVGSMGVIGVPTATLEELIAALDLQDVFVTADGGAMHLGAALSKPIVALFGDSDPEQWRPWGVPQRILHPGSRNVHDISPDMVFSNLVDLLGEVVHA
ncbi:MAG: glycosyltransferase family 9 protein [Fluviibacter sp.]